MRRLIAWLIGYVSPHLGEWLRAALAELDAIEDKVERLRWALGACAMGLAELVEHTVLPWRRAEGERPADGFAALLGVLLLIYPAYLAASVMLSPAGPDGLMPILDRMSRFTSPLDGLFLVAVPVAGVAGALWINLGVILRTTYLGGLAYAASVRLRLMNLIVLAAAAMIAVCLFIALKMLLTPPHQ